MNNNVFNLQYFDNNISEMERVLDNELKSLVYTKVLDLNVEYAHSKEPVKFSDKDKLEYKPLKVGESWGELFDCAWFHLSGKYANNDSKKIYLALDVSGEALLYSNDGYPLKGFTNGSSAFDTALGKPGKCYYEVTSLIENNELNLYLDCGCNDLFGNVKDNGALLYANLVTKNDDIELAGKILEAGGLVAFPTETVYGLGANALNENSVKNIYKAKGRPSDNPLIVHIAKKEDIIPLVKEVTPKAQALIDTFFPGALTIILPKSELVGNVVSGGLDTVAVRMPANEIAHRVIEAAHCPIAAPSANTSGLPSPTRAKYVIDDMAGKIDAIIDGGDCEYGVESTVITLASDVPTILRPGAVTKEMLEDVIGEVVVANAVLHGMKDNETAQSPGMKYKHYAPKARVVIVDANRKTYEAFVNKQKGAFALCFDEDEVDIPRVNYGSESDDLSQARELFDALRKLDEMGAKTVYARIPHTTGVGMAVYNRLIRAAAFTVIDLNKPFTLGLTGQSGAGKSYICKKLEKHGFNIVDCDDVVKNIYDNDKTLVKSLCDEFGDILTNGKLDRKKLGNIVFNDKSKLEKLNSLVHPAVIGRCESLAKLPCVLDAPQLFEAKAQNKCFKTIAVLASEKTRIERITKRDNITVEEAKKRLSSQFSEDYFKSTCDFVIYNNDEDDIDREIDDILHSLGF